MSNPEDQRPICMKKAFEDAHLSKKCACPQCAKDGEERVEYQPEFKEILRGIGGQDEREPAGPGFRDVEYRPADPQPGVYPGVSRVGSPESDLQTSETGLEHRLRD